ncbi:hypothetical protein [Streptomyces filamentosus]|uniref:hypothetical protein n=1 Tax=Streptomyces filamentosus TaxID=67294 RepID=UPI00123AE1A9|nr:hypothetical protein [Streptomyces filamentosus]KAA6218020.1 hypothetical protein CP979_14605 [Streptomyces filamentosus]
MNGSTLKERFLKRLRRPPSEDGNGQVLLLLALGVVWSLDGGVWEWLRPLGWLMALWAAEELVRRAVRRRRARRGPEGAA